MGSEKCDSNATCPTCDQAETCSEQEKEARDAKRREAAMLMIKHKFMVLSGKGGVGKSSVTVNLAVALAKQGFAVGIMDADIHGPNIPKMMGVEEQRPQGNQNGLLPVKTETGVMVMSVGFLLPDKDDAIIWRGPLKHSLIKQFVGDVFWGALDYLLIDLPPGTGDEALSAAYLINKVDGAIIVTTPQDVALLDSRKSITFCRELKIPLIGVVENMSGFVCPHCSKEINLFKVGGGEKAAREMKVPFLGRIPLDPEMVVSSDDGVPFVSKHFDSKVGEAFRQISEKWVQLLENKPDKKELFLEKFKTNTRQEVTMTRIAFSSEDNRGLMSQMSMHFGRCPYYTIVDVEGKDIKKVEVIENPYFENHTPGVVPRFIHSQNANVMIAGGMGPRAIEMFQGFGVEVATGVGGQVDDVLKGYLDGKVQGVTACAHDHDHHGEHEGCNH